MKTAHLGSMKSVEMSDETYEALQRLASAKKQTLAEALATLLDSERPSGGDQLLFQLGSADFSGSIDPADRYLALLAWVARHHAADFADFVAHQASASHYLRLNGNELNAVRQQHQTRRIEGTHYWAVMNIDPAAKRRFVCRLLEFIGCHDETVHEAVRILSLSPEKPVYRQSRSVA